MTLHTSKQAELSAKHKQFVLSSWMIQGGDAPVINRAEGRHLFDEDGNSYLDFSSGLVAVNLGHGHPKVVRAIQEQAARLCYSPTGYFQDKRAELGALLSSISPWAASGEGCRTFFTTGGAEANDDAVRLVRNLTGRFKVLAGYRSYHGSTGTAMTLTGEDRRWASEPAIAPGIVHFWTPYPYRSPFFTQDPHIETARALEHLERTLMHEGPNSVAAIITEPVIGSNGVIIFPEGYLQGLRRICDEHGILLIFDEVMTGFGRTGAAFASQRLGVIPDLTVFAKGVTSAYAPLGGIMLRESLAKTYDSRALPIGHTYAGHPLMVATGLATVQTYLEEGVFEQALVLENWLAEGLGALAAKHPIIGEARGLGAFWALEFVKDQDTREPLVPWHGAGPGIMKTFFGELKKRGVYAFGKFNIAMMTPPLTITRDELDIALTALDEAVTVLENA
jgi:taurine---2-oxoglutarate transaminase